MPRSPLAYLADIVEARDTIDLALHGLDLADYRRDPIIRAAVERQFITTGEAVNALSRLAPVPAGGISHGSMIVAFRDQLTHDHPSIDDEIVGGIAAHDFPHSGPSARRSSMISTLGVVTVRHPRRVRVAVNPRCMPGDRGGAHPCRPRGA